MRWLPLAAARLSGDDAVAVRPVRIGARAQQDVGSRHVVAPRGQCSAVVPSGSPAFTSAPLFSSGSQRREIGALDGVDERHARRRRVRRRETRDDKKRHGDERHVQPPSPASGSRWFHPRGPGRRRR